MNIIFRFMPLATIYCAIFVSVASAAGTAPTSGNSLLLTLFIGFFALIVIFQLVPACLMFFGMVKGLVKHKTEQEKSFNVKN